VASYACVPGTVNAARAAISGENSLARLFDFWYHIASFGMRRLRFWSCFTSPSRLTCRKRARST